jgi:hypothetical protein
VTFISSVHGQCQHKNSSRETHNQLSFNIHCFIKLTVTDRVINPDATEGQWNKCERCYHPKLISKKNNIKVMTATVKKLWTMKWFKRKETSAQQRGAEWVTMQNVIGNTTPWNHYVSCLPNTQLINNHVTCWMCCFIHSTRFQTCCKFTCLSGKHRTNSLKHITAASVCIHNLSSWTWANANTIATKE